MKISKLMFVLLTVMLTLASGITPAVFAADSIKVGEIQTYSQLTNFTFPYRNGWQLALEEINKAGGVLGKQIEVISRDDQGKPGEAVKVAEELVSKDELQFLMLTQKILFFRRSDGWAVLGRDKMRSQKLPYQGDERRQTAFFSIEP